MTFIILDLLTGWNWGNCASVFSCQAAQEDKVLNFPIQPDLATSGIGQHSAFYKQLACGFFVSWEITGNLMRAAMAGKIEGLLVRVLGIGRVPPE
jgi:hypothetical protein